MNCNNEIVVREELKRKGSLKRVAITGRSINEAQLVELFVPLPSCSLTITKSAVALVNLPLQVEI